MMCEIFLGTFIVIFVSQSINHISNQRLYFNASTDDCFPFFDVELSCKRDMNVTRVVCNSWSLIGYNATLPSPDRYNIHHIISHQYPKFNEFFNLFYHRIMSIAAIHYCSSNPSAYDDSSLVSNDVSVTMNYVHSFNFNLNRHTHRDPTIDNFMMTNALLFNKPTCSAETLRAVLRRFYDLNV